MAVVREELSLTKEQIGNIIIASVAITIIARLFIGWLCDRIGPWPAELADTVLGLVERYGTGYVTSAPAPAPVLSPRGGLLIHQCMECQTE